MRPEFDHVVSRMQDIENLTFSEAVKHLRHEELCQENSQEVQEKSLAMKATTTGKGAGQDTRECYFCHEKGHVKRFCPELKKKIEEKKRGKLKKRKLRRKRLRMKRTRSQNLRRQVSLWTQSSLASC